MASFLPSWRGWCDSLTSSQTAARYSTGAYWTEDARCVPCVFTTWLTLITCYITPECPCMSDYDTLSPPYKEKRYYIDCGSSYRSAVSTVVFIKGLIFGFSPGLRCKTDSFKWFDFLTKTLKKQWLSWIEWARNINENDITNRQQFIVILY